MTTFPTLAEANTKELAYVSESVFGTTPSTPACKRIRITDEDLRMAFETEFTNEIRADYQQADIARLAASGLGGFNFAFNAATYDDFLAALLYSSGWSSEVESTCADHEFTANTIVRADAGNFVADGFLANMWIRVHNADEANNNGYFKLSTVVALTLTISSGGTFTVDASDTNAVVTQGAVITCGTDLTSFVFEGPLLASEYAVFNGFVPKSFNLKIAAKSLMTGRFDFLGAGEITGTTGIGDGGGSYADANTNPVFNSTDNIFKSWVSNANYPLLGLDLTVDNNIEALAECGELKPIGMGKGTFGVTGKMTAYYRDKTQYDEFVDWGARNLALVVHDSSGSGLASAAPPNGYIFDLPQLKYSNFVRHAGGVNQRIIADCDISAYRHSTIDTSFRVFRWQ